MVARENLWNQKRKKEKNKFFISAMVVVESKKLCSLVNKCLDENKRKKNVKWVKGWAMKMNLKDDLKFINVKKRNLSHINIIKS